MAYCGLNLWTSRLSLSSWALGVASEDVVNETMHGVVWDLQIRSYDGRGKGASGFADDEVSIALAILFPRVLHVGERHMRAVGRSDHRCPGI